MSILLRENIEVVTPSPVGDRYSVESAGKVVFPYPQWATDTVCNKLSLTPLFAGVNNPVLTFLTIQMPAHNQHVWYAEYVPLGADFCDKRNRLEIALAVKGVPIWKFKDFPAILDNSLKLIFQVILCCVPSAEVVT